MGDFFEYYMPTRVIRGNNCLIEYSKYLRKFGKKALIVTGKNSSKLNGSLDDAIGALEKESIRYKIFDKVDDNPGINLIQEIYNQFQNEKIEFILGLGGGSSIDAAKAVGVLFRNPDFTAEEAFNMKNLKSIPIVAVPTSAGTGSEVTPYSIISDHKNRIKKDFGQESFPKIAYLDARYTYHISREQTLNNAFDAFSHLIEGYLNKRATFMTDLIAERGLRVFYEIKEKMESGELTHKERQRLHTASMLGGIVISQTGTSIPHALGYVLTTEKGLPHGSASAAIYRGYLELFKDNEKLKNVLKILGMESVDELNNTILKVLDYKIHLTEEEIQQYTNNMLNNMGKMRNHPDTLKKEDIKYIYSRVSRKEK